ncbi:hypothetical protein TWF718_010638 [Orbilia javanica]|uniref:Uncharacterized protein n=1 Tax=Orbilia javanica TaxID=47235 RepID=A0AAN8REH2_9PEZI
MMYSRLLSLPKELREEIFRHALQPTVMFYFRDGDIGDSDDEDDTLEPRILLSYEIGPIPQYLLQIHPMIAHDVRDVYPLLLHQISKTIEQAIQIPDEDEKRFWDKSFVPEPSPEFLTIARRSRFILDLPARYSVDAMDLIAMSPSLARNITYIAFHGFNDRVLNSLFTCCPAVQTVALFCFPTPISRWIASPSFFVKYANYGGRAGNPMMYSRLEYIFEVGDCGKKQSNNGHLPDQGTIMRPACKRRQMDTRELDERGRAVFFLMQSRDGETRDCVEGTVIAYEFTEPPLL